MERAKVCVDLLKSTYTSRESGTVYLYSCLNLYWFSLVNITKQMCREQSTLYSVTYFQTVKNCGNQFECITEGNIKKWTNFLRWQNKDIQENPKTSPYCELMSKISVLLFFLFLVKIYSLLNMFFFFFLYCWWKFHLFKVH